MSIYLLVETCLTGDSQTVRSFLDLASQLSEDGHQVDLFLLQNGVLIARTNAEPSLAALVAKPEVSVRVDDFSLSSRSLKPAELVPGVRVAGMSELVELLTRPGCKPIWH